MSIVQQKKRIRRFIMISFYFMKKNIFTTKTRNLEITKIIFFRAFVINLPSMVPVYPG